jgi:hypothetical protein
VAVETLDLELAGVAPVTEEDRLGRTLIPTDQRVRIEGELGALHSSRGREHGRACRRSLRLEAERYQYEAGNGDQADNHFR